MGTTRRNTTADESIRGTANLNGDLTQYITRSITSQHNIATSSLVGTATSKNRSAVRSLNNLDFIHQRDRQLRHTNSTYNCIRETETGENKRKQFQQKQFEQKQQPPISNVNNKHDLGMMAETALHAFMGELLCANPSIQMIDGSDTSSSSIPDPPSNAPMPFSVSIVSDNARPLTRPPPLRQLRPLHYEERRDSDDPPRAPPKRTTSLPIDAKRLSRALPRCRWYDITSEGSSCHSDDEVDSMRALASMSTSSIPTREDSDDAPMMPLSRHAVRRQQTPRQAQRSIPPLTIPPNPKFGSSMSRWESTKTTFVAKRDSLTAPPRRTRSTSTESTQTQVQAMALPLPLPQMSQFLDASVQVQPNNRAVVPRSLRSLAY